MRNLRTTIPPLLAVLLAALLATAPLAAQERERIVEGLRRPEKPGYGTRRAASRAHRLRCIPLVMRQHHGAGRALPGELGKPSYGYHMLDFIH